MTDKEYLHYALAQMHTGQWFGFSSDEQSYSTLIIHDSWITKPTEAEVNAKIEELKQDVANKETKKASAKQKLLDLGLTEEEIKLTFGI